MTAKYFEQISAGMKMLDYAKPNWRKDLDLDVLCMSDMRRCVLGQLYGDFSDGVFYLSGLSGLEKWEWAQGFGFDAPFLAGYVTLTAEWKAAISGHPSFCE